VLKDQRVQKELKNPKRLVQKKQKELKDMIANLSHGDTVITQGGLYGKVVGLTDTMVTLEIADKVRVKVGRNFISAVVQKAGKEQPT